MDVKGTIQLIDETKIISSSFKKRDIVVKTQEQYPQEILIQFTQDKCDVLNGYNVGENVTVSINLRGRSWKNPQGETKYFNTIEGWRINKDGNTVPQSSIEDDGDDSLLF